jgi:multisubunit Na+/H+ antiporter MnhB subunit
MDAPTPTTGQVSADGQFIWNGTEWQPTSGFRIEPTPDSRRMQVLAGAYMLVAGVLTALLSIFAMSYVRQATEQALQQQNNGMTPDQIKSIVDLSVTVGVAIAIGFALVYVVFGVLTLLRPASWIFYADLVILGLSGLGVFTNLYSVARGGAGPLAFLIPNLALSLAALALFIWMLLTRVRGGGVWAGRKVPNTEL